MIDEAQALADAPSLQVSAVKALQQRWQAEAQEVPVDRRQEQKLWDAFRKPLDEAFSRKPAERGGRGASVNLESLNAHDRAVLEASKQLEAASADGDAQKIRAALAALEELLRAAPAVAEAQPVSTAPAAAPAAAERPVKAVRGDDRPGMRKEAAPVAAVGRKPAPRGARDDRFERSARGPRLGDIAFRAQREAQEHAQLALRKLTSQAHGEALTQLMEAWVKRDAALVPAAQDLGKVSNATRNLWSNAVGGAAKGDAAEALLRLEMAADVSTPADQLPARRAMQLQLLTNRKAADPRTTWEQDVVVVLASDRSDSAATRLQTALKALLRGSK